MNGSKLLIDTNIVLYFLQGHSELTKILTEYHLAVSFISELELLSFGKLSPEDDSLIKTFLKFVYIIDINHSIKSKTVELRATKKLKLPDAIIAATAISQNIPLMTADKDFSKIKDSRIILFEV